MCPVAWYPVEPLRADPLVLYEPDALLDEAWHQVLVRLDHILQEADTRLGLRGERSPVLPLTLLRQGLQSFFLQIIRFYVNNSTRSVTQIVLNGTLSFSVQYGWGGGGAV